MSRVICYKCNQANTGVLSQTLEQGITTCPEGWSTSIPNCDPKITVGAPEGGCDAFFEQSCSSTGQVEVEITILSSLLNVQVQNASTNTQLSTCSSAQSPFTVTANNGDLIRVTGYCQDPTLEETWDGGVSVPKPTWAEDNCGNTAVSSTTKIVFFYDTTSLGSGARLNMYNAANDWLLDIQATDGYTGEVYHIEMGGERWVLWPAWLLDLTIDVDGINNPTNASACGANTPSSNWDANEAILAEWNSDSSSYVQATGSQGATKAMPAQIAAGEDVLVVIFADEAVGQPCGYSNTNTGAASGGLGGYHNVAADDQNNTIVTSAHAYYDVALPACITGTPKTLWHHDYDTATPKIAAHNAGSGNIRTYIYPSQPTGTVPGTQRRSFALHVWMAVNSGDANGLLNSGTTPPSCQIADLQNAVSTGSNSNPYYLGGFGQLDTFGFGANVECKAFTMHDFKADLDAFLSLNQNTCDGTDCAAVLVIKPDGTPVSNEQITIGSTTVSTDASGYTALVSGLSGAVKFTSNNEYTFEAFSVIFETGDLEGDGLFEVRLHHDDFFASAPGEVIGSWELTLDENMAREYYVFTGDTDCITLTPFSSYWLSVHPINNIDEALWLFSEGDYTHSMSNDMGNSWSNSELDQVGCTKIFGEQIYESSGTQPDNELVYDWALEDLNINSEYFGQDIGPSTFINNQHVSVYYFGKAG